MSIENLSNDHSLMQELYEQEILRQKELRNWISLMLCAFLITVIVFSLFAKYNDITWLLVIPMCILLVYWDKPIKFSKHFKACFYQKIFMHFFKSQYCDNPQIISDEDLKSTEILDFSERIVWGSLDFEHNGTGYKVSETELSDYGKGGKVTLFKGVILKLQLNNTVANKIIIVPKDAPIARSFLIPSLFLGFASFLPLVIGESCNFGEYFAATIFFIFLLCLNIPFICMRKGLKEIKVPVLRKNFKVYSSDKIDAAKILTEEFVKHFMNVKTAFKSNRIKCSFNENNFILAIDKRRNIFKIGNFFMPVNNPTGFEQFQEEINSINKMITHFKLNERIGL